VATTGSASESFFSNNVICERISTWFRQLLEIMGNCFNPPSTDDDQLLRDGPSISNSTVEQLQDQVSYF
jgi:hypothetical protein